MEKFSVNSCTKFTVIEELNSEFTLCKGYVMGLGKNRNFSSFDKEPVENALPSLNYVPVVAHLFKDENGNYRIGGHDYTFTEDWEYKSLCVPFGVVKENSFGYEVINEYGTDVEYLTCECILWTGRYPELKEAIYSDDVWFNQSMEINVNQFRNLEEDSNYTEILDFEFSALCLLNKSDNKDENIEPCFISSKIVPINFSTDDFADKLAEMKEAISKCFSLKSKEGDDNVNENMELDTELNTNEELENTEDTETTPEVKENVEDEVYEVELKTEILESEDFEAKYNEALAEIEQLKAQITELTPYKLAVEKAEREKAESDIFAKFDSRIGDMPEYKTLKEKSGEYDLEQLDKECIMLVGMFAMRDVEEKEVTNLKFSVETTPKKASPYGDWFERYANND